MIRRPPRSTRTDTLFPYTTLFRSSDTRVPGSRVQHLDIRRGPLERHFRLATLVIHTAGTRHSEVSLSGLDAGDAERLRDHLARQTDDDRSEERRVGTGGVSKCRSRWAPEP